MAIRNSGKHGRRKVSVPNVTGSSRSNAQTSITAASLTYSESSTNTSDSGLSQIVQSQGISSGSVVLIGSDVPFTYYNYVAPPPPIIATPPPIIAVTPPIIAAVDCSTASCGNDPGRACCFYLRGVCRAC